MLCACSCCGSSSVSHRRRQPWESAVRLRPSAASTLSCCFNLLWKVSHDDSHKHSCDPLLFPLYKHVHLHQLTGSSCPHCDQVRSIFLSPHLTAGKTEAKEMELRVPLSLEGMAGLGLGPAAEGTQTSAGSGHVRATSGPFCSFKQNNNTNFSQHSPSA